MKRFFTVLVILLPLGVMAAPAGNGSFPTPDLQTHWSALPVNASPASQAVPQAFLKDRGTTLILAHSAADSPGKSDGGPDDDIDLREVDWDKVKAGKKSKNGNLKNGGNGEEKGNGEKDGDDEKDDRKDDEEKGEGGGWDRPWDCPKLG